MLKKNGNRINHNASILVKAENDRKWNKSLERRLSIARVEMLLEYSCSTRKSRNIFLAYHVFNNCRLYRMRKYGHKDHVWETSITYLQTCRFSLQVWSLKRLKSLGTCDREKSGWANSCSHLKCTCRNISDTLCINGENGGAIEKLFKRMEFRIGVQDLLGSHFPETTTWEN